MDFNKQLSDKLCPRLSDSGFRDGGNRDFVDVEDVREGGRRTTGVRRSVDFNVVNVHAGSRGTEDMRDSVVHEDASVRNGGLGATGDSDCVDINDNVCSGGGQSADFSVLCDRTIGHGTHSSHSTPVDGTLCLGRGRVALRDLMTTPGCRVRRDAESSEVVDALQRERGRFANEKRAWEEQSIRLREEASALETERIRTELRAARLEEELCRLKDSSIEHRSEPVYEARESWEASGSVVGSSRVGGCLVSSLPGEARSSEARRGTALDTHGSCITGVTTGALHTEVHSMARDGRYDSVGAARLKTKPQLYKGEESWMDYKAHFEVIAQLNGWGYAERGLWLASSLAGDARMVLSTVPIQYQTDFDRLVCALEQRFQPKNQVAMYRAQLRARRRLAGESLGQLAEAIKRLVILAYPDADLSMQDLLAKDSFLDSLVDRDLVWQVRVARPENLEAAVQVAVEYESFRSLQTPSRCSSEASGLAQVEERGSGRGERGSQKEGKPPSQEVMALQARIDELEKLLLTKVETGFRRRPREGEPRGTPLRCFNCGQVGHIQIRCPKLMSGKGLKRRRKKLVGNKAEESRGTVRPATAGAYVAVKVLDCPIYALVDTGATVSCISPAFADELKSRGAKIQPHEDTIVVANEQTITTLGKVTLKVVMCGLKLPTTFLIAPVCDNLILGYDFMKEHQCAVHPENDTLRIQGRTVDLVFEGRLGVHRAALVSKIVLAPRTETIVYGKLMSGGIRRPLKRQGIIEPVEALASEKGVVTARTLVLPRQGRVPVRLMNPNDISVELPAKTVVGRFEEATVVERGGGHVVRKIHGSDEYHLGNDKLDDLLARSGEHLPDEALASVAQALKRNMDIFALSDEDLGRTNIVEHNIDVEGRTPIKQPLRRLPIHQKDKVIELVEDMLDKEVIEPSTSAWSSPVVLVKKRDGAARFCVDYRLLNEATVKDAYPLPRIDDTLDSLGGAKYYSTMDMMSGYWQVGMDPRDKEKTAFATTQGLFEFNVMPFGLCNAPATFQRLMEVVLAGLQWDICLVYLDDIIVYGRTVEEHLANLELVWDRVRRAGLKLKPSKCHLFKTSVKFLGHVISSEGIEVDPEKIQSVKDCKEPRTVREVRSFLGLCSYYRRFVKNFAKIAAPLHNLTKKGEKFKWLQEHKSSFEHLKEVLTETPVLAFPDPSKPFILDTDASGYGIGAVLSQVSEGQERVVAYGSRVLSRPERRYNVTRRELLAIVHFVKKFRPYLYGQYFTIRTDHGAIRWLTKFKQPEGQLARWLEVLGSYHFRIEHRAGRVHSNADALSREPVVRPEDPHEEEDPGLQERVKQLLRNLQDGEETGSLCDEELGETRLARFAVLTLDSQPSSAGAGKRRKGTSGASPRLETVPEPAALRTVTVVDRLRNDIREAQEEDKTVTIVREWRRQADRPTYSRVSEEGPEARSLWLQWNHLEEIEGILHRRLPQAGGPDRIQAFVPRKLRQDVFAWAHSASTAGHLGVHKTISRIKHNYFWPGLKRMIQMYIAGCQVCQRLKGRKGKAPLTKQVTGTPLGRVAVDIVGPIRPPTTNGSSYILVISDYFTKFVEAFPLADIEAATVTTCFVEEFCLRYGIPEQLHSDQGRQFESRLLKDVCKLLGIKKTRTTPYRPQSDGLVERFNRTVKQMLTAYVESESDQWDEVLPHVMSAYRATTQESTGMTPNFMMFGREVNTPLEVIYGVAEPEKLQVHEYAKELLDNLNRAHEFARSKLQRAATRQKNLYDRSSRGWDLEEGDPVWLHDPVGTRGVPRKFKKYWTGPYIVTRRFSSILFAVQDGAGREQICHIDRLRKMKMALDDKEGDDDVMDAPVDDEVEEADDWRDGTGPVSSPTKPPEVTTRSGRVVRAPRRYLE